MKRAHLHLVTAILLAGAALGISSCKEDTIIQSDLIPGTDKINVFEVNTDTLTINTTTVIIDTLNTSAEVSGQPIVHGLGTVNDPYFGTTHSGIYFQVLPSTNQYIFPGNVDSAFVILPYIGFKWGDTLRARTESNIQKFTVYRTEEILNKDAVYYSNNRKPVNEKVSLPYSFDMKNITEYPTVLGRARVPHLRIPLDMNSPLMQNIRGTAANSTSSAEFINFLRGLYVEPDTTQNGILMPYFYMNGANDYERTAIQFFYTDGDTARSFFFNFNSSECAHYSRIKRDNNKLSGLINAANATQELVLLQNEPGAAIDVKIPNIKNLPLGVVNKATLEFTQVSMPGSDKYLPPSRIVPYMVDNSGIVSALNEASGFTDGSRQEISLGGFTIFKFQINIGNTVQKAIAGKWDTLHLRITGAKGFPGAYSLIAGGRNNSDPALKTKLTILYSKPQQ